MANATLLFVAGYETTAALIGTSVLALLRHREAWDTLRAKPALLPGAIEELLRYEPPVQLFGRQAQEDTVIGDARVGRGQTVFVLTGAVNRDPAQFPDPDRFDLARNDGHVTFGHGAHACLGQALARLETEIALRVLLERCPDLRLCGQPVWRDARQLRALDSLLVES